MPYLFLSYARADADGHLERFADDLCREVRLKTGLGLEEIGFRDLEDLRLGSDWRQSLAEAIGSTRVFIALCSPSYFASDMCGREWQMFAELTRSRQHPPGKLLPIMWVPVPPRNLPHVARWLQHSHADFGERYLEEGLNYLIRLKRNRDDYREFVMRFAEHVVAAADDDPPPAPTWTLDLNDTPNAFLIGPTSSASERDRVERHALGPAPPVASPDPEPQGPHHVTFVVVAAPLAEIAQVREDTHFYADNPYHWSPYRPHSSRRICASAQRVAAVKEMTSKPVWASAKTSLATLHAQAAARNQILAVIVDVWTTRLEHYRQVLVAYDQRHKPDARWTSPVLVPWSDGDAELKALATERRADLGRAFPLISTRGEALFRDDIPTIDQFRTALDEVLTMAQSRIFASGDVRRRGDDGDERPFLSPPD